MNILARGVVKSQFSLTNKSYEIRKLDRKMISTIIALHASDNQDETLYIPLTEEELEYIFKNNGMMVGVFINDELVGYHSVLFPTVEDNLGKDIGLTKKQQELVFHLEAAFIVPEYRGNSLQKVLSYALIALIKEKQSYRYLCETVSPTNISSIKNTLEINTLIVNLKYKYGGQLRYIFFQDILTPVTVDKSHSVTISIDDVESQMALLGNGHYGYELLIRDSEFYLSFAKIK